MPGRHGSPPTLPAGRVPLAVRAAAAAVPTGAFVAALGLAGGGLLTGRADVASCGALVGAAGLAVERHAARELRRRLRHERAQGRDAVREIGRDLQELRVELASLRTDLDLVRADRDAALERLHDAAAELQPAPAEFQPAPAELQAAPAELQAAPPVPALPVPVEVPAARRPAVPGQLRSPLATGGIPVLPPGPSEPLRVIDLRAGARTGGSDRPVLFVVTGRHVA